VAPLLDVVDEYERYAIVLVDKRHARLFSVYMGEIEESDKLQDFVPGKHDQGGYSQANYQRHHEAHVYRHLKHVVERLNDLYRSRSFDRLVLAGPDEALSEFQRLLPRPLAQRVVGTFHAETSAGTAEILEKTLAVERQVERAHEERLIDDLLETAGAGGRASLGLAPTLEAIWLGDVQTLFVADRLSVAGSECPSCGWLAEGSNETCPACGATMKPVHDVVHRAMARTLEQSGTVEVVHDTVADRLREVAGGIGALLRYVASVPIGNADSTSGSGAAARSA
jgi:peptide chain release factor subunit 1